MAQLGVMFRKGPGLISNTISWFGQGPRGWSHAASVLESGKFLDARSDRCGDVPSGVYERDPDSEPWISQCLCTLEVSQPTYDDWFANLQAKVTTKYARWDIVEDFILRKDKHVAGQWFCSALAVNALQHVKIIRYPLPIPAHLIVPNALLLLVAQAGFTIGPIECAPGYEPKLSA